VSQPKLLSAGRIVTCEDGVDLGAIDDGALLIDGGLVSAIGPREALVAAHPDVEHEAHPDVLVTPGLVDAHTHAVWAGSRAGEYAMRMAGADYEQIAEAGGGIVASMRAVREATVTSLRDDLEARLRRMAALGVTTVEVKSGYGLDEENERKQLEAIAALRSRDDLPALVPTFLGMHALPPEAQGDKRGYAARCKLWLERIAADRLAEYVDAYIDRSAFSVEEARPVLERARELGLGVRLHIGQFADVGGAKLATELQAASVDHLEHLSEQAAEALAEAAIPAVMLPVASFSLNQAPPPIEMLRRAGMRFIVASDANPGSAPTESLPLAMAFAARSYGLSFGEVLLGATRRAAESLGSEAGVLRVGAPADLVVWDLTHEHEIIQPWGSSRVRRVLRSGRPLSLA
jgi:imidazolonepropionase